MPTDGPPVDAVPRVAVAAATEPRRGPTVAVVGVDPGRNVGLAWVDAEGRMLRAEVADLAALARLEVDPDAVVALGDGTGSGEARAALARAGHTVAMVDEFATSEEGRRLYWRDHPVRGWRRWPPAGLRVPPRPLDDYAAYAIALRWLGRTSAAPARSDRGR